MTKEQAIKGLKENLCSLCAYGSQNMDSCDIRGCDNRDYIKALERDNEEIFKQFKTKAFYESQDILGLDMVDTYMITDYLAELMGQKNE